MIRKQEIRKKENGVFVRNFIFGVEDSLVSTVGLLSGIASAGATRQTIFLAGTVLIFVEAFSMATGSFLSEESTEEYERKRAPSNKTSLLASIIMFFSYFLTGFVPLSPYLLFENNIAFVVSIISSLISLFILGLVSASIVRKNYLKKAVEMLILGGAAIGAGVLVGNVVNTL